MKHFFTFSLVLLFTTLSTTKAQNNFYRNDSIIVLDQNNDTLKNPWAGGINFAQFSQIDLNLDGKLDLFIFDRTGNKFTTYLNIGGTNQTIYKHTLAYNNNFPRLHDWVLFRDYNCDGMLDIFTYSTGGMAVYKNTSTTSLQFFPVTNLLYSDFQPNYLNLYVSSADIPAIDDVDNDGDLDILTFSILGTFVEYHKNLSMETYGHCDSLKYQLRNKCWGYFSENFSSNSVSFQDTCGWNVSPAERLSNINSYISAIKQKKYNGGNKHSGSTLFMLDVDSNESKDLVLGDVSFSNLTLLYNMDTTEFKVSSNIAAQDTLFPSNHSNTAGVDLDVHPAGFYMDVNNDNIKDLIVGANCFSGCDNYKSAWYYKNIGHTDKPVFKLQTKSFMQEDMIEVGEGANPTLLDYNSDGLLDILIGNYGYNDSLSNYTSSLALYENIGTQNTPAFKLIDTDYANISALNLNTSLNIPALGLHPTSGDIDGDGDIDLLIGDTEGKIHYFENNAGTGNTVNFVFNQANYQGIDVGTDASPQLFDLDNDGLLDLVVGRKEGYLSYYKNTGTTTSPTFTLITDSLGYAHTINHQNYDGYSVPFFYRSNNTTQLLCGTKLGYVFEFSNIDGNLNGTFNKLDTLKSNIWEGIRSTITGGDLNNDGKIDLLIGNYSGGISLYMGGGPIGVNDYANKLEKPLIYPNPSNGNFIVELKANYYSNAQINIYDIIGHLVHSSTINATKTSLNLNHLKQGMYLLSISNNNKTTPFVEKIIINE